MEEKEQQIEQLEEITTNFKPKNPMDEVRLALFNYDLELCACESRQNFLKSKLEYFKGDLSPKGKRIVIGLLIDEKRERALHDALVSQKNITYNRVEEIIKTCNHRNQKIWLMYFIQNIDVEDIAKALNYSLRGTYKIIARMKEQLWTYSQGEENNASNKQD